MMQIAALDALPYIPMADVDADVIRKADPWNMFSSHDY
jgi:hypothetical protein